MTRKSKHRNASQEPVKNPLEPPPEPRAEEGGFAFPIGENAEIGDAKFFCRAVGCPGYSYRATDKPHPFGTCGAILNAIEHVEKTNSMNDPIEQNAPAVVNESNVGQVDMPPLDPDAHYDNEPLADNSPAAQGDELPASVVPSEEPLPSPIEDMLPRIVTGDEAAYFLEPSRDNAQKLVPRADTFWCQGTEPPNCYHVLGVNQTEGFALCDYHCAGLKFECLVHLSHFTNADLSPYLSSPKFTQKSERALTPDGIVRPYVKNYISRGLRPSSLLCMWVPIDGSWWSRVDAVSQYLQVIAVDEIPKMGAAIENIIVTRYFGPTQQKQESRASIGDFLDGSLKYLGMDHHDSVLIPLWVTGQFEGFPPESRQPSS